MSWYQIPGTRVWDSVERLIHAQKNLEPGYKFVDSVHDSEGTGNIIVCGMKVEENGVETFHYYLVKYDGGAHTLCTDPKWPDFFKASIAKAKEAKAQKKLDAEAPWDKTQADVLEFEEYEKLNPCATQADKEKFLTRFK